MKYRPLILLAMVLQAWSLSAQPYPERRLAPLPEFNRYVQPNPQYVVGQLILLGFSADGKLAFVNEPPDEACGCYMFEFQILDLATNKRQYSKKVEIEGSLHQDWDKVWKIHGKEFQSQMDKFGIRVSYPQVNALPVNTAQGLLPCRVLGSWRDSDLGTGERYLNSAQVWLGNKATGQRRIATYNWKDHYVLGVEPRWYVVSETNEYAAVLLLRVDRGWEGPPNPAYLQVVGFKI